MPNEPEEQPVPVNGSQHDGERGPRSPVRWWEQGEEPDYRATMANERTFLAWSRTALALLAGALAVLGIGRVGPYGLRLALACYLILLAVAATVAGYWQWRVRQRRMRLREPLGHSSVNAMLGLAFLVLTGIVVVTVAVGAR
ncbi:YidH family protein [Kitasatospora purpeofusca]|uniref:YidH family protein n=1 Tax=Kitasatospora purpeofusca TaxID=67352 RepID=UPI0036A942F4